MTCGPPLTAAIAYAKLVSWTATTVDFCGDSCNMPTPGLGDYQGSYYQYDRTTQTASSTLLVRDTMTATTSRSMATTTLLRAA